MLLFKLNHSVRRLVTFSLVLLCSIPALRAQNNVTVSGQVFDETNQPLMGVGVIQQGTSNGVATDLDGNYSITAPVGSTLQFSSIGYKDVSYTVPAGGGTFNVQLEPDTEMLEETVVVGYGIQRKSDLTGSISSVKTEDMQNRSIVSVDQALAGKTAGVTVFSSSAKPGEVGDIRIRGISSNGSSAPLYVVDGSIASSINTLDPNDIESMEILKDGASAAIYGARAGNGVILITTKRGSGTGRVSYDFQYSIQRLGHMPEIMNAREYVQYYLEDGRFTQATFDALWDGKTDTNWLEEVIEPSVMTRHSVSFSSGNERGSIYASLSYSDNNGVLKGKEDTYTRLTGMVNASWKIKPWLEITSNNQIGHFKTIMFSDASEYGNNPILSTVQLDPLTSVTYTLQNMPAHMQAIMNNEAYGELLGDGSGNYYGVSAFMLNSTINPLIALESGRTVRQGFNINGTTALNLTPIKGLTLTSRLGYRLSASESYGYVNDYYVNVNAYQNWGSVSASDSTPTYWQWETFANYNKQFGPHNLTVMAGTSYNQSRSFSISGSYAGTNDTFGFTYDDPRFFYFAYATGGATRSLSGGEPLYTRNLSYFGRVNWSYGRKYLLQVSLRADAADSSVLPAQTRWGYFPSISAGWTVTEEPWMAGARQIIPFLKVRASWGQNGSTASLGNYRYANVITANGAYPIEVGANNVYATAYSPSSTGNNNLKWETSEQLNFGIDMRFLNDRLTFTADYFDKTTRDLIVTGVRPSNVIGVTVSPVNAGNVKNTGTEFELRWSDSIGDFNYSISGNFSTLKNKVTKVHENLSSINGSNYHQLGTVTRFEEGYPAWYFYGYKFAGVDTTTGDSIFEDVDGIDGVSSNDKTYLGSGIPTYSYGLTFNASWKGFDLLVFGSGSGGNQIWCLLDRADYAVNKLKVFTEDRWTPSHTAASRPRAGASNYAETMVSSASLFDGDFFKIKQIQLGYSLPSSLLKAVRMQNVRVYLSLDDFFTFTKYPGFDPEVVGTGQSMGIDRGSYPNTKKVVFGANIAF